MRRFLFYLALIISLSIYALQRDNIGLPSWINNYVNDFLTLPLVLSICQFVLRKLKAKTNLVLSLWVILAVALYYSIYFEWYLPQYNPRYTSDWLDCLMYLGGSLVFYLLNSYPRYLLLKEKDHDK